MNVCSTGYYFSCHSLQNLENILMADGYDIVVTIRVLIWTNVTDEFDIQFIKLSNENCLFSLYP